MATPTSNPKVEELRARFKNDPKSRHFYPLAEELRKNGQLDEAEKILRTGLELHGSYLSAWVGIGRVLRELRKLGDAVEAFKKALLLDPSNVVAARHLAECYLETGDKVEAIKKFKLVHALLPSDEVIEQQIDQLEHELNPHKFEDQLTGSAAEKVAAAIATREPEHRPESTNPQLEPAVRDADSGLATSFFETEDESPTQESAGGEDGDEKRTVVEEPEAGRGAITADAASGSEASAIQLASEGSEERVETESQSITETETMADLYASQGHTDRAVTIYERILERDPANEEVRRRLESLRGGSQESPTSNVAKIQKLEKWIQKVARQ